MRVPETILAQLGGNRFIAMTGAKQFVGSADALSFQIPRNSRKITGVRVKLDRNDAYTVEFYRKAPRDPVLKISIGVELATARENVYAENLRDVFTTETGLLTSL